MYVDGFRENADDKKGEKINSFFAREEKEPVAEEVVSIPENKIIAHRPEDVLAHWQAPEFETYETDGRYLAYLGLVLAVIVAYAIYTNSPIMAITFILIGVVAYIYMHKEARTLDFMITYDGVMAGREIYEFENIKSFWIFYEPNGLKVVSLHTKSFLPPYVHIPLHEENPVEVREVLMKFIPEIKQEAGVVDALERLLRI